jgi:hypothetical protein
MNAPTDRLLLMLVVATGFAVLVGGWAGGLARAELTGWVELAVRVGLAVLFFVVLVGLWQVFSGIDEDSS